MNYFKQAAHFAVVFLLIASTCLGATGDITAVVVRPDGISADVTVAGFTYGSTKAFGMSGGNVNKTSASTPYFTVVSMGYDNTGTATTVTRTVYCVCPARVVATTGWLGGTFTSGTFLAGETITEATSGATGVIIRPQSAGSRFTFARTSGTFATALVVTGGTSAATFLSSSALNLYADYTDDELCDGTPNLTFRVVLSDAIYAKDNSGVGNSGTAVTFTAPAAFVTNSGGASQTSNVATAIAVTNSSTLSYPKGIGHWAVEDRRPVNGIQHVEVFGAHKYGTNGIPFACVKISMIGAGGHNENATITKMTQSTRVDKLPVYDAPLTLSIGQGYARGEVVTGRFTAYPWIGDSGATLDSTTDAGSITCQLGPLHWTIMDAVYACVDGVGAGTPAVSTVQATAEATPYANYASAIAAIKSFNNATYGLNRSDGGIVLLKPATYTWAQPTESTVNGYYTMQPASTATQANTIWAQSSAANQNLYQRMYNMTITRSGATFMFFAGGSNVLVMEKINFSDSQTQGWYSGDTNTDLTLLDCTSNSSYFVKGGSDGHCRLLRNYNLTPTTLSGATTAGSALCVLGMQQSSGSTSSVWQPIASSGTNNLVFAYSKIYGVDDTVALNSASVDMSNCAFVVNLIERLGTVGFPVAEISEVNLSNILTAHCTYAGNRFNHQNDLGTTNANFTATDYVHRNNSFNSDADHPSDLRCVVQGNTANAYAKIGFWGECYHVGSVNNHAEQLTYSGQTDFYGVNCITKNAPSGSGNAVPAGYVSDASYSGTTLGNGNYMPTTSSILLNRIPSGQALMPVDAQGRYIPNNGTGSIGAIQRPNQALLLAF